MNGRNITEAIGDMSEQSVGRLLLRYSLPAIAGYLASAFYQVIDRVVVGRGVGTDGIAAITAAFPLSIMTVAFGVFVGSGTSNRISVLLGQGDRDEAERVLGQGVRLGLINGTLLTVAVWLFTTPLLIASGCATRLLPLAVPFTRIVAAGQVFLVTLISMGSILRVMGRPMLGLVLMLSSNLLNAALACIAVFWLGWGVSGTAAATAFSQAAACLAVLAFVQSRSSSLRIHWRFLKADRTVAQSILTLGAPAGMTQILAMLVFLAANHGAAAMGGTRGVAAFGVLNTIAILLSFPSLGVMQAMQPLVGYNKGAQRVDRVRALLVHVLFSTASLGVLFSGLVTMFPGSIACIFSKNDPELVEMVRHALPWFVFPGVLFSVEGTMSYYFLSVHEPRRAGILLLGRQALAIPLFFALPHCLGFLGICLVSTCADLPFALAAAVFMVRELGMLRQSHTETQQDVEALVDSAGA